jgi:hypothetical protein
MIDGTFLHVPHSTLIGSAGSAIVGVAGLQTGAQNTRNLHDRASQDVLCGRIAGLLGIPHLGLHAAGSSAADSLFLVPDETLGVAEAASLGIDDGNRMFGGIVPHPFVATKAITHGLVSPQAVRPPGWSDSMADAIAFAVLPGFTVFDRADALIAGERLLERGPARIKPVRGKAGLGQTVVRDRAALAAVLAEQDAVEMLHYGLCLEENLTEVATYSVGAAIIGPHRIAYWGTQRLTANGAGEEVYGGSSLTAVPGGLAELHAAAPDPLVRHVVAQAMTFHDAAHAAYPGLHLTRSNYDVIEGTDAAGQRQVAVLEQSWRIGGASGAEIAAMEAFATDPTLTSVRAATVEEHARGAPPPGATVYFDGVDPVVGPLAKWAERLG